MNTVGPYHNRQETYSFFSLPYCKGPQHEIGHYHETMAEALQGVELEFSGLEIGFKGTYYIMACLTCLLRRPPFSIRNTSCLDIDVVDIAPSE